MVYKLANSLTHNTNNTNSLTHNTNNANNTNLTHNTNNTNSLPHNTSWCLYWNFLARVNECAGEAYTQYIMFVSWRGQADLLQTLNHDAGIGISWLK